MSTQVLHTSNERMVSGAMALVMHALFFALLVFGVSWQKQRQPEAIVVDLWNNLPPVSAPKPEPAPEVKPDPEPPKPQPPKVEAKPVPKAEPKPVPKPELKPQVKPDIALKDKKEKERKAQEQAQAEKQKQEQLAALKAKEAAQRAVREQEDALKKVAQQQAAAQDKLKNEYIERIRARIRRFIVEPPNLQGNPEVQVDIVLLPGGEVLGVKIKKASGQAAWDSAVERAILKAQPLPVPSPESPIFKEFRELSPLFRPKE